jgi:hypothetical protein
MFATALTNNTMTRTWNGALSFATPDTTGETEGRVSLFFKAIRGIDDMDLYNYMTKASIEDLVDTIILAFYSRDPRGGRGERDIGRKMLRWVLENHPSQFSKVMHLIPDYSRWDDITSLFPKIGDISSLVQSDLVKLFCSQLQKDYDLMNEGKPISLAAKWAPTEGDSDDKKYKLVKQICSEMKIDPKTYRKKYTTPLRAYLNIVETKMCSGRWNEIDFNKVPSCAMKRLKKAFEKHTPVEFTQWKNALVKGEAKVNAKQLFPHELIKEIRKGKYDPVVTEEQWKVLEAEVKKLGKFKKAVCVVDVSGSMQQPDNLPLDIACAMGLIISNTVEGDFHNLVITFHENPTFVKINEASLLDRYNQIRRIPWGGSTNLQAVFDMILEKSERANLSEEDSPDTIIIVSDMQFNQVDSGYGYSRGTTNFEAIDKKYAEVGRKRPKILFWNVNGSTGDFPVTISDEGTVMISGASPSVIKSVFNSESFDTVSIMRNSLDDERYQPIRQLLI